MTLPRLSRTSRLAGVKLTRSDLAETDVAELDEFRVTSAIRTVADLGRTLPRIDAVILLDTALHRRIANLRSLQCWVATHPGYRGIRSLRRAISEAEPAAESPMETRLRLLLVDNGLPRPVAQIRLVDDAGFFIARPDLYYPSHRLAIEYDGVTHRTSLAADNRRQNALLEAGYKLLRFTAGDVLGTPAEVVRQVKRALDYSSSSSVG